MRPQRQRHPQCEVIESNIGHVDSCCSVKSTLFVYACLPVSTDHWFKCILPAVSMSAVFSSFQPKWKSEQTHAYPFWVTKYHKTSRKIKVHWTLLMKHICYLTARMRDRLSLSLSLFFRKHSSIIHLPSIVLEGAIDHCFSSIESAKSCRTFFPLPSSRPLCLQLHLLTELKALSQVPV